MDHGLYFVDHLTKLPVPLGVVESKLFPQLHFYY